MPTGETMEEGDDSGAAMPAQESVTISSDLLGGVPVKNGDKLTFCATSDPDDQGNVQGYFEAAESEEAPDDDESWERDALKVGKNNSEGEM